MVLHLLGKKGWHVYNGDNVERVRRDEADAKAREEAREQRMQDEDAARRLAILRGETPPELTAEEPEEPRSSTRSNHAAHPHKRRRLRGEDDTDADIRHARQDVAAGEHARKTLGEAGREHEDAPLLDYAGHLQLIPAPDEKAIRKAEKNAEAEAEKAKKRQREEQQYTMRFTDAAGFNSSVQQKPWYAAGQTAKAGDETASSNAVVLADAQGKDVWGNEDPLRKEREQSRISKGDPFAAMQQAQRQLKQSERDRERWRKEREVETGEIRRAERREERRRRMRSERRHRDDGDSLDGFRLDGEDHGERRDKRREHKQRHCHRRRSRSRSPGRWRDRKRSREC